MPRRFESTFAWLLAAGFSLVWLVLGRSALDQARAHDFLSFYTGGWMLAHGRTAALYEPAAQLAAQRQWSGPTAALVPFIRPPFYALLLAPLGWLPFETAFRCWIALQILLLLACWIWAFRQFGPIAPAIGSLSISSALGIAHGQDGVVFLAVLLATYSLAVRGRTGPAGVSLGLMFVKFHLTPLWTVVLAAQRRWKMLAGFAATGAAAAAASVALVGTVGISSYIALLRNRDLEWLSPSPEFMISFQGMAANLGIRSTIGQAGIVLVVLVLFGLAIRGAPLWRVFAATITASLLAVPHVYGYDGAMLLCGLWLAVAYAKDRYVRITAFWLATPFPFCFTLLGKPWAVASSLSLLLFLAALARDARTGDSAPALHS